MGIFIIIPRFRLIGVIWTLATAFVTFFNFKNAFTKEGMATQEIIFFAIFSQLAVIKRTIKHKKTSIKLYFKWFFEV